MWKISFKDWLFETKGLIDVKSVSNDTLHKLNITGNYSFKYPNGEICKGKKFVPSDINFIKNNIKSGYYAVVWDNNLVKVIFKNHIFKIKDWVKDLDKVIAYGKKQGISSMYFKNLNKSLS